MVLELPEPVRRLFWGDDPDNFRWPENASYITRIVLEKGDSDAVKWLFRMTTAEEILKSLDSYKLSPKSKTFWLTYLSV